MLRLTLLTSLLVPAALQPAAGFAAGLATSLAHAGDGPAPATRPDEAAARVPSYPNSACPVMGKPVSASLYVDTDLGRIWVCCKGCFAEVRADVALAHRTAYPAVETVKNERCPVTGRALGEGAVEVVLQGKRFRVADAAAAKQARAESQVTLARLVEPKLVEVGNGQCPVDGKAVAPNAFVVIDGRIVRLSSPKHVKDATAAPARTLARALELARQRR